MALNVLRMREPYMGSGRRGRSAPGYNLCRRIFLSVFQRCGQPAQFAWVGARHRTCNATSGGPTRGRMWFPSHFGARRNAWKLL